SSAPSSSLIIAPAPNNNLKILSLLVVSPLASLPNNTDFSSVKPSTSRSINCASISSLENSTLSSFVSPSIDGRVKIPLGSPTYSLEPSSRVLANTTATYGALSVLPIEVIPSFSSKPSNTCLSSIGILWNCDVTVISPLETAISAVLLSP